MKITFRNYTPEPFHTEDYLKVREFLVRINSGRLYTPEFLWGRWEWAVTHSWRDQDPTKLEKIGLWEDEGKLIALATYELHLGRGYLIVDENYAHLKAEMIDYAQNALHDNGKIKLYLPNGDEGFQREALTRGWRPSQDYDRISVLDTDMIQPYALKDGFSFVSMADGWNWQQYNRVLHRGFNHEGAPKHDEETIAGQKRALSSPMINPELIVAVVAPDGNYVAHCGMWYKLGEFHCYVEPVCVDPDYRKMGLGKAVVLEAIRRCAELGAKQAVVTSGQQFYYNIGFYPIKTMTYWEK